MATASDSKPFGLNKNDAELLKSFNYTLKELRNFIIINIEFYHRGKSSIHARYYATSCILLERTQVLEPLVFEIIPRLHEFDFSETVQANGYRSFISIVNRCCLHLLQLCRHISVNKASLLFRSTHYLRELEAYTETLGQLVACLGYLKQLISFSHDGELFVEDGHVVADSLLLEVEMLNTDCFYGRCLGFQFCESIQKVLQAVMVAMATFSECYEEQSQIMQLATSLFNSGKYVVDHELRARQVVNTTRTADIKFCKAFWSIPDSNILHQLRSFTFPHVEVSEIISLVPENFELPVAGSSHTVMITPACAHTGHEAVKVRLISHAFREGMQVTRPRYPPKTSGGKVEVLPPSRGLLFHCHGGGFVAQSSKSHENYLRVWARTMECPILSVDYSLAPDQPFPRALEECFYAYAWALKYPERIGWTGEYICFAGDSAGANLVISTALRAISYGIRVPDGIVVSYPVILVQYTPSPARFMSMIDPLLPVGILTRCLAAYAGIADKFSSALAKPIFCNPGNKESWELVDEKDVTEQSIGDKIANHNHCDKTGDKSSFENKICQSCHKTGAGGPKMCSDCGDEENGDTSDTDESTDSVVGGNTAGDDCDSLVEMEEDQFVIYDMEELQADPNYQGRTTLTDELKAFGKQAQSIVSEVNQNGDNVEQMVESDNEKQSYVKREHGVPSESVVVPSESAIVQEKVDHDGEDVRNEVSIVEKNEQDNLESGATIHAQTIAEALCKIDSTVTIQVDPGESEGPGEKQIEKLEVNRTRTVCRSMEDLCDDDNRSVQDESPVCGSPGIIKQTNVNEDSSTMDTEKQNIPTNTTDRMTNADKQTDHAYPESSQPTKHENAAMKNGSEDDTDGMKCSDENRDAFGSWTLESLQDDRSDIQVRFSRRAMSLDLPVTFHPGNPVSPLPQSGSPVSPKLPTGSRSFTPKMYSVRRKITQSPIQLFRHLPIVKNMYMSPILAPDDMLKALPHVDILACHFDPLLDDSVMFARRLARLGNSVDLTVFDNLPHGFLSFSDTSPEAKKASSSCVEKIMAILHPGKGY